MRKMLESHGFDEENDYLFGLEVNTSTNMIEEIFTEDGIDDDDIDWDKIMKISMELDSLIESKVSKAIGNVAVAEFHDNDDYVCTFWADKNDQKIKKYLKSLPVEDDFKHGENTMILVDGYDFVERGDMDKLNKKFDSDYVSVIVEAVTVCFNIPTYLFEEYGL